MSIVIDNTSSILAVIVEASIDCIFVVFTVLSDVISFTLTSVSVVSIDTESIIFARIFWETGIMLVNNFEDVWQEVIYIRIYTWILLLGTTDTKRYNTSKHLQGSVHTTDWSCITSTNEWTTRVSLAGIETTLFVSGADVLFSIDKDVFGFIPVNTGVVSQNRHIDFIKDSLISSESSITPSSDGTVHLVCSVIWWWEIVWKTDWPDEFVELDISGSLEEADIVDDLSGANSIAIVAGNLIEIVSFLVS